MGDMAATDAPSEFQPGLFTPSFGTSPNILVGRDDTLADLKRGIMSGPGGHGFISTLIGPRGCGKTVLLNEIEDHAASLGWPVISVDAVTEGLDERIHQQIEAARAHTPLIDESVPAAETRQRTASAGINVWPARFAIEVSKRLHENRGTRHLLTALGSHAASRGVAVLITVDEMQAMQRDSLRRLAADLQHVTNREKIPVAFVGGALTDLHYMISEDRDLSFFGRCFRPEIPSIDARDAAAFFERTTSEGGGRIDREAVAMLVENCNGLPYKMQLLGHHAWRAADAPWATIEREHALAAVQAAERRMIDEVAHPLWGTMGSNERAYVTALARHGSELPFSDVCDIFEYAEWVDEATDRLARSGCIMHERNHGIVRLGPLLDAESLREIAPSRFNSPEAPDTARGADASTGRNRDICGKPMKRVPGSCVMPPNHAGRCRSKM